MRLGQLTIRTLPGIDREFTFKPRAPGVNLVVGPNATGKSSLVRALKYLLGSDKSDPPALALEAEFEDGETRWQVTRNGSQIAWRRDGEQYVGRPALPGADQIGLYRLSVESLLDAGDTHDEKLAARLRRERFGDCDLDAPRAEAEPATRRRFGQRERRALDDAVRARQQVKNEYAGLQRQEATLPDLQRRIETAAEAGSRGQRLDQALKLADVIEERKARARQLEGFPPEMDRLQGEELKRLDAHEEKAAKLRETLRARRSELESAQAELDGTGLAQAAPAAEMLQAAGEKLRALDKLAAERDNARAAVVQASAAVQDALGHFDGTGEPPQIDAGACRRAEKLASDWIAATKRLSELREQLKAAGAAPDAALVDRLRDGTKALRDWLAARAVEAQPQAPASRWPALAAAGSALAAAVAAGWALYLQAQPLALLAAAAAVVAVLAALGFRRAIRVQSPRLQQTADAEQRFTSTGLDAPPQWDRQSVGVRLRAVEDEWDTLRAQQKRAGGAERLRAEIEASTAELGRLKGDKDELAAEIGFDPALPAAAFDRFVRLAANWDQARKQHAEQTAGAADLDRRITDTARSVREFLDAWPAQGAGGDAHNAGGGDENVAEGTADIELLRSTFERLQQRVAAAQAARSAIGEGERAIESIRQQMAEVEADTQRVYAAAGLPAADRAALAGLLERLEDWKAARRALEEAETAARLAREELASHPELIEQAGAGQRAQLQAEHAAASSKAAEHIRLVQEQQAIRTKLDDAGSDRRLEQAAAAEDRARQTLEDRREEALLAVATAVLLDDVEQAFKAEHEPHILRRASAIFDDVTAHAFKLVLDPDGKFAARDVRQDTVRALGELSSGTRMQLLLALRLARTEEQEQDGRTLPLFLDEALTTSDEARFTVVAQSLERIAAAGDGRQRQIFYLSARRHEATLWRQATGSEPALIDLEQVRFPAAAAAPAAYRVAQPPGLPAPADGESAEEYASRLGVPRFDPRQPPGSVHPFHVLRDDLPLLHLLMDTWRSTSLGQLEALLASDAAQAALPGGSDRQRIRQRCRAVRGWVALWGQGRGRPVDRGALEQCGDAVSGVFIDRVTALAERLGGDGAALVAALRAGQMPRFQTSKTDVLEQWLADNGYIDDQERLTAGERRRLTLPHVAPETAAGARDVNQVVDWLEAAAGWLKAAAETSG